MSKKQATQKQTKKSGRPAHTPTDKDRQMVEVLSGFGIPNIKIADVLDVSINTLVKHYARELHRGSAMVEAKLAGNLLRIASGADGAALKAIMFALNCRFGWSQYAPRPPDKPLGKKEQMQNEAETAHEETGWGSLVH